MRSARGGGGTEASTEGRREGGAESVALRLWERDVGRGMLWSLSARGVSFSFSTRNESDSR